ncbi:hypothetical protein RB195_018116 [Necator americanus]|uniref:Domain of unknown function DB domain-containing protein n=1 Tax=Necator americanus TaxID=51031 RepID=A0ABR1CAH6_NECAM
MLVRVFFFLMSKYKSRWSSQGSLVHVAISRSLLPRPQRLSADPVDERIASEICGEKTVQVITVLNLLTIMLFFLIAILISMTYSRNANEKLIRCCHGDPEIDTTCAEKYCRIPAIVPHMVVPFIAECAPKGNTVPHVWDCLSSRHDHTECCKRQGVIPHCLPYCKANGPVPTDMLRYGVCIGEFEKYRVCFRTYLKHHPSVRGDQ